MGTATTRLATRDATIGRIFCGLTLQHEMGETAHRRQEPLVRSTQYSERACVEQLGVTSEPRVEES